MSSIEQDFHRSDIHPIDIVESLAEDHDWACDRVCDDQIAMAIEGNWRTYSLTLAWSAADETLRIICAFDMSVPVRRRRHLSEAMERANDLCWLGAFTLWPERKMMVWRYGLTLAGGAMAQASQIAEMVRVAVAASERFYPAFQLVAWDRETPEKAMDIAMAEAYGRA